MNKIFFVIIFLFGLSNTSFSLTFSNGSQVDIQWEISCGVDKGSIIIDGNDYTFKESSNLCDGNKNKWSWKQRSELISNKISINSKDKYLFKSKISFLSESKNKFTFFQIHDGRDACAPPLKVDWDNRGLIKFYSHYKVKGKGEEYCIPNYELIKAPLIQTKYLKRDGTEYDIEIIIDFDGQGNFDVLVKVDEEDALKGRYNSSQKFDKVKTEGGLTVKNPNLQKSTKFDFKHGNYSKDFFEYTLISNGMSITKID